MKKEGRPSFCYFSRLKRELKTFPMLALACKMRSRAAGVFFQFSSPCSISTRPLLVLNGERKEEGV